MKGHFLFFGIVLVSLVLAPALGGEQDTSAKISFEQTVCDLGQVGLGSKNSCEFRFTNTGQGPLKITSVKSTCGCTVAQLDKKEYAEDTQARPRRIDGEFELGGLYHSPAEFGRCAARI